MTADRQAGRAAGAAAAAPEPGRFPLRERELLLTAQGLGPLAVQRLEEAGLSSMAALSTLGAEAAARRVCDRLGNPAWMNRRRALERALATQAAAAAR